MGKYKDFTETVGKLLGEYEAEWYRAHDVADEMIASYVELFGELPELEED